MKKNKILKIVGIFVLILALVILLLAFLIFNKDKEEKSKEKEPQSEETEVTKNIAYPSKEAALEFLQTYEDFSKNQYEFVSEDAESYTFKQTTNVEEGMEKYLVVTKEGAVQELYSNILNPNEFVE